MQNKKPCIWKYLATQKQWKAYLCDLLDYSDDAVKLAIINIDSMQTVPEKDSGQSIEENTVGWTKVDASEMGLIADKIKSGQQLTAGEIAKSRNKMKKYWKQLMFQIQNRMAQKEAQNNTPISSV